MAKLIYTTKSPKKGFTFNESFMTHENSSFYDPLPSNDIQREAMNIVGESMRELIQKLDDLGYDPTRVRFLIHTK